MQKLSSQRVHDKVHAAAICRSQYVSQERFVRGAKDAIFSNAERLGQKSGFLGRVGRGVHLNMKLSFCILHGTEIIYLRSGSLTDIHGGYASRRCCSLNQDRLAKIKHVRISCAVLELSLDSPVLESNDRRLRAPV